MTPEEAFRLGWALAILWRHHKMKIYSRFKARPIEAAPSGEKEETTFEMHIDQNGHKSIKKSGKTNIYEKIQASYEDTKIENIIARAMGGDSSGLLTHEGQYLDITDAPQTLAEAQQSIQAIRNVFNKLPLEIKTKYDMSVEKYIADFGSEKWQKIMGIEKEQPAIEPEIHPETSKKPEINVQPATEKAGEKA